MSHPLAVLDRGDVGDRSIRAPSGVAELRVVPLEKREPCGLLGPSALVSCPAGGFRPIYSREAFILFQAQLTHRGAQPPRETNSR